MLTVAAQRVALARHVMNEPDGAVLVPLALLVELFGADLLDDLADRAEQPSAVLKLREAAKIGRTR